MIACWLVDRPPKPKRLHESITKICVITLPLSVQMHILDNQTGNVQKIRCLVSIKPMNHLSILSHFCSSVGELFAYRQVQALLAIMSRELKASLSNCSVGSADSDSWGDWRPSGLKEVAVSQTESTLTPPPEWSCDGGTGSSQWHESESDWDSGSWKGNDSWDDDRSGGWHAWNTWCTWQPHGDEEIDARYYGEHNTGGNDASIEDIGQQLLQAAVAALKTKDGGNAGGAKSDLIMAKEK